MMASALDRSLASIPKPPNRLGNIVLQTSDGTQFRVFKGILSDNSEIFKDMFSIGQAIETEEYVEGCPVIHLADDPDDLMYALKAMHNWRYIRLPFKISQF
jgi:hypothetical protein